MPVSYTHLKGGGVCAGNKLTVSGAPCITGNLGKDGAANNVYLGRRETIHVGGALESGASIGVTTADPVIDGSYVRIADGTGLAADTTSYFTSDAYPGCTKRLMEMCIRDRNTPTAPAASRAARSG